MNKTFLVLLLLLSLPAFAQQPWSGTISIGTLTYAGTVGAVANNQYICAYQVHIDTTDVTLDPIKIVSETMYVDGESAWEIPQQAPNGWNWFFLCNKPVVAALQLQFSKSGNPVTLTLVNGDTFRTKGIVTVVLSALPGKKALIANQSIPIVLQQMTSD
jgi:hypothetical protein